MSAVGGAFSHIPYLSGQSWSWPSDYGGGGERDKRVFQKMSQDPRAMGLRLQGGCETDMFRGKASRCGCRMPVSDHLDGVPPPRVDREWTWVWV